MPGILTGAVRRRLRGKQSAPYSCSGPPSPNLAPGFGDPVLTGGILTGAVRRRLRGKQSAPYPCSGSPSPGLAPGFGNPILTGVTKAIHAEQRAADGLLPLPGDARKFHIHWIHSRTHNPQDVQPHQLSREELWNHLVKCYKEAYPDADSETGSPLDFGLVCKEQHKDAAREEDRSEHPLHPQHLSHPSAPCANVYGNFKMH